MKILQCRHFLTLSLKWFKETVDYGESEDKSRLISYTTGLISQKENDGVDPEECLSIFQFPLKSIIRRNWMGLHSLKKGKVQILSLLKNTIKLNDKRVFVDSIKLFHRLILVSDREITIQKSLKQGGSSKPV